MSNTVFLTTVISVLVAQIAIVYAIVWYFGSRIDRLDSRIDNLAETVQLLREDVAVLKATH